MILCEDLRGQREALRVAERARAAVAEPFLLRGHDVTVRASIGIASARRGQTHAQDVIREADTAMYRAKQRHSGVELFDTTMDAYALNELEIEHQLRGAIERNELRLHYQPVLTLALATRGWSPSRRSCAGSSRTAGCSRPQISCRWPRRPG